MSTHYAPSNAIPKPVPDPPTDPGAESPDTPREWALWRYDRIRWLEHRTKTLNLELRGYHVRSPNYETALAHLRAAQHELHALEKEGRDELDGDAY